MRDFTADPDGRLEKVKAHQAKKKEERLKAQEEVYTYIQAYGDEAVKKAFAVLFPTLCGAQRTRTSFRPTATEFLVSLFPDGIGTKITDCEVFEEHRLGRTEMRYYIAKAAEGAKNARSQDDWVKITYDPAARTYTLDAVGAMLAKG